MRFPFQNHLEDFEHHHDHHLDDLDDEAGKEDNYTYHPHHGMVVHHHTAGGGGGTNGTATGTTSSSKKKKKRRKKKKQRERIATPSSSSSSSSSSSDSEDGNVNKSATKVAVVHNHHHHQHQSHPEASSSPSNNGAAPAMAVTPAETMPNTMISTRPQLSSSESTTNATAIVGAQNGNNNSLAESNSSIFIKKDYLPSSLRAQVEDKRTVSRVLSFGTPKAEDKTSQVTIIPTTPTASSTSPPVCVTTNQVTTVTQGTGAEIIEEATPQTPVASGKTSSSTSSSCKKRESSSSCSEPGHDKTNCSKCIKRAARRKAEKSSSSSRTSSSTSANTKSSGASRIGTVNRLANVNPDEYKHLKYGKYFKRETHPNGGASVVHMYQDEIQHLPEDQFNELVDEFFSVVFEEDKNGYALNVMGVVHDAAAYLPDLLEHMAENYASLTVKAGVLGRNSDIETLTMLQYHEQVAKNYSQGTFRYGPLHQISLVGKVMEEVGGYFPDLLSRLESNPFLKKTMPWGEKSIIHMDPRLSNDGPILWIRPGEQLIPTAEINKTPMKRQRTRINELTNLQYLPRSSEAREIMFEDRTRAHADHVGHGHERQTTAAVGILKAVHCGAKEKLNRITKVRGRVGAIWLQDIDACVLF